MAALAEWNDSRLNEMARRVENAATKDELRDFRTMVDRQNGDIRRELTERADGVKSEVNLVGRKVEELVGDPISEKRARTAALRTAIVGALAGGLVTFLLFIITNHPVS